MEKSRKILIVDDDPKALLLMEEILNMYGYDLILLGDVRQLIQTAIKEKPDLIFLDIMMPEKDGFVACKELKGDPACKHIPILILTARDDEIDRVVGLEVGADDYLTKPFSMRELLARVKAQLRRTQVIREELEKVKAGEAAPQDMLTFGNLVISQTRREVTLDGEVIPLKPQEYDLLVFFAEHKRQMLSREFILERLWGWDYIGDSRTVDVHVRWLRQKIENDPANPSRLVTVRGGGYRFEG